MEHLLLLAPVIHASEILRVLPARIGNGFFGLTTKREGESLFADTLLTVAQLAAPRIEAVDCLRALIASRHFDNAYAGIALTALCHADDRDLVGHISLLRRALADMFREFVTPEEYKHELARSVLDAVGLRTVVQALPSLEYFDPQDELAPLDTWFAGACLGGKRPLLRRDETKGHIYFFRPNKPSVREPLPQQDERLGDFIALLRDATYAEEAVPIPVPKSKASPKDVNELACAFGFAVTR
ncbi:MAG: hypothetical protein M3495_20755 [Pseudomonadota bacterium]|nr:hypothetical protein [Pseudomonadota bacterium]